MALCILYKTVGCRQQEQFHTQTLYDLARISSTYSFRVAYNGRLREPVYAAAGFM